MATLYPSALDSLSNPGPTDNLATVSHSAQHANANDAIEAIQTALGTNPQGGSASVKARLDTMDTAAASYVSGPVSSGAYRIATFSGTTGKIVQDSGAGIDVSGNLTLVGTVSASGLGGSLLSTTNPVMNGATSYGTSTIPARQDHVHPSDSTKISIPGSVVDATLLRFSGTLGTVQSSTVTVSGGGDVAGIVALTTTGATVLGSTLQVETTIRVGGATGPLILSGAGAPAVSAPVGSIYQRTDGGANTSLYVKESGTGTSGWVAK